MLSKVEGDSFQLDLICILHAHPSHKKLEIERFKKNFFFLEIFRYSQVSIFISFRDNSIFICLFFDRNLASGIVDPKY